MHQNLVPVINFQNKQDRAKRSTTEKKEIVIFVKAFNSTTKESQVET